MSNLFARKLIANLMTPKFKASLAHQLVVNQIMRSSVICNKCGHKWIPRGTVTMCPDCKSKYWNQEKCARVQPSEEANK